MQFEVQRNDALTQALRQEALARYPQEACGLIVGVGKKTRFVPCRNISPFPKEQFVLCPEDYMKAADMGEVIALWHSHPEGTCEPSDADRAGCQAMQIPWLISAIRKEGEGFCHLGPQLIEPDGFKADYIGRPYVFGVFDCYTLFVDYYEREFGIKLDPYPELREMDWWKSGKDFFGEHFAAQDFIEVTDGTWQQGDGLIFSVDSLVPNHIAIYVTGDIILHHVNGRLSRRDTLSGFWGDRITHHIRHRSKC